MMLHLKEVIKFTFRTLYFKLQTRDCIRVFCYDSL